MFAVMVPYELMMPLPSPINGAKDLHENLHYFGNAAFLEAIKSNELNWNWTQEFAWEVHC